MLEKKNSYDQLQSIQENSILLENLLQHFRLPEKLSDTYFPIRSVGVRESVHWEQMG